MMILKILITIVFAMAGLGTCCCMAQGTSLDIVESTHSKGLLYTNMQNNRSVYTFAIAEPVGSLTYGLITKNKTMIKMGLEVACAKGISAAIAEGYKRLSDRSRQGVSYSDYVHHFPSYNQAAAARQTTIAFATATDLTLRYKKWYIAVPAYAYAGSIASSGMYTGKLQAGDMFNSMVVGTASGLMAHWLTQKFMHTKQKTTVTSF